jgi:hypothetical protein
MKVGNESFPFFLHQSLVVNFFMRSIAVTKQLDKWQTQKFIQKVQLSVGVVR